MIRETTGMIVQIKNRLLATHSRQKSYTDVRRKPLEFKVGDKVMLKVSPWKGVVRFGKCRKLSPRYIGSFKILSRVGPKAYKLKLPRELQGVRNTFHVSNLKKCLSNEDLIIPLDEVRIDEKLHFIGEPIEIMDREVKQLKKSRIPIVLEGNSAMENLVVAYGNLNIVMENPNHPNKDIPEENPVIPEPNHVEDAHDPNEMVDIPDDEELPGNINGWLEEDDDMNKNINNEDIKDEDVEIEVDDDAELIFPYEVEGDQTPLPRDESSNPEPHNAEPPNAESSDSESEDEEVDVAPEATVGTSTQKPYDIRDFPRGLYEVGESSSARDLSYAELSTNQTEIALLKSKDKIGEKEREILNHDLENVERALGNVLERVSVLESGENATLKKRLDETETKLAWARMERDIAERRLHESRVWNKMFYLDMVRIGAVPKPPSDDEDTERPRKKSKNSTSDGTEGPSEPRGPPSDS
ncbi:hypothetical protein Tco_0286559 [Tanacetum coccineum]